MGRAGSHHAMDALRRAAGRRSTARLCACALVLAALPAVGSSAAASGAGSAWPQLGFNAAHTGVNPNETALSAANVPTLTQQWIHQQGINPPDDPVAAGGLVYFVGSDGVLVALNGMTGAPTWSFTEPSTLTDPVVVGSVVYTSASEELYALNARTGAVERATPIVANAGLVYAGGVLYTEPADSSGPVPMGAYSASTGEQLWTANVGSLIAPPAVGDGEVFALDNQGNGAGQRVLRARSAVDGHALWSRVIGPQVNATPVVSGNTVIVTTIAAHMVALNATTGALLWRKTMGPKRTTFGESAPAIYRGKVYQILELGCVNGRHLSGITVRGLTTGTRVWSHVYENIPCADAKVGGGGPRSPTIANGLVYLPAMNAKKIRIFTTGGKPVTVLSTGEFTMSTVVVAAGQLYVSTWDPFQSPDGAGYLQAFSP